MEQLSGINSTFLAIEKTTMPLAVSSVSIYEGHGDTDFPAIRQAFLNGIAKFPAFRRRLVTVPASLDHPYWIEDPDFDVDCHLRRLALAKPGNWHQFYLQVARLQATPMHRDRPLWQAYMIDGLDGLSGLPKGSFAIIMRVHRSVADNCQLNEMMMRMHTLDPEIPDTRALDMSTHELAPGAGQLLAHAARNYTNRLWTSRKLLARGFDRLRRQREHGLDMPELPPLADTRFNHSPSSFRVVSHLPINRKEANAMRRQVPGSSLCDVMLTLIGGGMRYYLERKGELPEQSLIASVPQRVIGELQRGEQANSPGNLRLALHTDCASPLTRLRRLQQETLAARARDPESDFTLANDSTAMLSPLMLKLGASGYRRLGARAPFGHNTYINGVRGADAPLYFAGARMLQNFSLAPLLPGSALSHCVSRWGDTLTLGINACREALPDPDAYSKSLQDAWRDMRRELLPAEQEPETTISIAETGVVQAFAESA